MDKLPDPVRAHLERDEVNVTALEQLIDRQPMHNRNYLLKLIGSETTMWGLSAEPGTPDSFLIDRAFEKVKGYRKINKHKK